MERIDLRQGLKGAMKLPMKLPLKMGLIGGFIDSIISKIKSIPGLVVASDPAIHKPDRPIFDNEVLSLNGVDQYGGTGITQDLSLSEFSFEAVVAIGSVISGHVISQADGLGTGRILLRIENGFVASSLGGISQSSTLAIPLNTPTKIGVHYDNGVVTLMRGDDTFVYNATQEYATGELLVGVNKSENGNYFKGNISSIKGIVNGALLAQYDLQGNGLDASGNGNHLTLVGAPPFIVDNSAELADADRVNSVGYGTSDGTDIPIGERVPAHATLPNVDYLGNPLTYGAGYPAKPQPRQSACAVFDGTFGAYAELPSFDLTNNEWEMSGFVNISDLTNNPILSQADGSGTGRTILQSSEGGDNRWFTFLGGTGGLAFNIPVVTGEDLLFTLHYNLGTLTLTVGDAQDTINITNEVNDGVLYLARSKSGTTNGFLSASGLNINGTSIPLNNAATGFDLASDGSLATYFGGVTQGTQDEYHVEYEQGFTNYTHATLPDFHAVYENGQPIDGSEIIAQGYTFDQEHVAIDGHNGGAYVLSTQITEGGDQPPAWNGILPVDMVPTDPESSIFQWRNLDGGEQADRILGFTTAPSAEEQTAIDKYHEG